MKTLNRTALVPLALSALVAAGCEDITGAADVATATVSLSFTTPGAVEAATGPSAAVAPIQDPSGRILAIEQVQVVLREVELERRTELPGCTTGDDDPCEKFEAGPVLIDLPLDGGVITPFEVEIPAGVYDELELEIKKPEDDSTSAAFFAAHPEWPERGALRVRGTFDANDGAGPQPFDIFLNVDADIEMELVPPFVVSDTTTADFNITLSIDVARWFVMDNGSLIDPRGAGTDGDVADRVEDNMDDTFEAFEDDDRDGHHDGSDDDGDDDNSGPGS